MVDGVQRMIIFLMTTPHFLVGNCHYSRVDLISGHGKRYIAGILACQIKIKVRARTHIHYSTVGFFSSDILAEEVVVIEQGQL